MPFTMRVNIVHNETAETNWDTRDRENGFSQSFRCRKLAETQYRFSEACRPAKVRSGVP